MYSWCFNKNCHGLISDIDKAIECGYAINPSNVINTLIDKLSRNRRLQRNNKIKNKSKIFRFCYSIDNGVAIIISRFSHWILVLSKGKEHLYHQNSDIFKATEYASMLFDNPPEYHLHKVFEDNPMAIHQAFLEIENHDAYVVKNRYYKI